MILQPRGLGLSPLTSPLLIFPSISPGSNLSTDPTTATVSVSQLQDFMSTTATTSSTAGPTPTDSNISMAASLNKTQDLLLESPRILPANPPHPPTHHAGEESPFDMDFGGMPVPAILSPSKSLNVNVTATFTEDLSIVFAGVDLKSLTIEGSIHLSISPHTDRPFYLRVHDRAKHIGTSLANATYLHEAMGTSGDADTSTTYTCRIPLSCSAPDKPDQSAFIPAFRYRTVDSLKPMPLRIQSRVQLSPGKARLVAQVRKGSRRARVKKRKRYQQRCFHSFQLLVGREGQAQRE